MSHKERTRFGHQCRSLQSRALLLTAIFASSVASAQDIVKLFEAERPASAPYARVLVVGAHADTAIRRQFEEAVVREISSRRTEAISSLSVMGVDREINAETLLAASAEADAAAVVITRLIDVQYSAELDSGRSTATARRRNSVTLIDFFRYDYVEIPDPVSINLSTTVVVVSDLYDVENQAKLWSAESTAFEKRNSFEVIETRAKRISRQLRRDRFTR